MSDIEILLWMAYVLGWLVVMIIMRKESWVYGFFSGMAWPLLIVLISPMWLFKASKRLSNILGW